MTVPHPVLERAQTRVDDRQAIVTALFDRAASEYDRSSAVGSLGSGQFYRRWVLRHYGLRAGMRLLDVATGTGLVVRGAAAILPGPGAVIGLDPSERMLREARKGHSAPLVQGVAEALPFGDGAFDFLSMGYALRHVADLPLSVAECLRVLKPGGRLLVLEISAPRSIVGRWVARAYFRGVVPCAARLVTGSEQAAQLMRYHWDAIAAGAPPEAIVRALTAAGFVEVSRRARAGLLSEYTGRKPDRGAAPALR